MQQSQSSESAIRHRTLRGIIRATTVPHIRTVQRIAATFDRTVDDLCSPVSLDNKVFDRATNRLIEKIATEYVRDFHGWQQADYDELFSRFGVGGQLTEEGVLVAAREMNANREVIRKARIVLESDEREFLTVFIENLFLRATTASQLTEDADPCAA